MSLTIIDEIRKEEKIEIELIRISVKCSLCGHKWGIKTRELKDIIETGDKFKCFRCRFGNPKL